MFDLLTKKTNYFKNNPIDFKSDYIESEICYCIDYLLINSIDTIETVYFINKLLKYNDTSVNVCNYVGRDYIINIKKQCNNH
jgi:hypothetical protein